MFDATVRGLEGLQETDRELAALRDFKVDLGGAAAEVVSALQDANRRARLAGLDAAGNPLAPLAESTLKQKHGRSDDTPLAPHGAGSRVVTNYVVVPEVAGDTLRFSTGWVGMPWLAAVARGGRGGPARDIVGLPPGGLDEADRIVIGHADEQVRAALADDRGGFGGTF
jgi:hypothetical protein